MASQQAFAGGRRSSGL